MRNWIMIVALGATCSLLIGACNRGKHESKGKEVTSAHKGATCAEQAAELRSWVLKSQRTVHHDPAPAVRHLVVAGTSPLDKGSCVSLSLVHDQPDDRIVFGGLTVARGVLTRHEQFRALLHNNFMVTGGRCLFLSIDEKVRWSSVVKVAHQMELIVQKEQHSAEASERWSKANPKRAREIQRKAEKLMKEIGLQGEAAPKGRGPSKPKKTTIEIALIFQPHAPLRPPVSSAMERKLQKMGIAPTPGGPGARDRSKILDAVHDLWRDPLFGECMIYKDFPSGALHAATGSGDHAKKAKVFADHLARRVQTCDCKLDIDSLKSLVYYIHTNRTAYDAVWLRSDPDGVSVKVPADTPWSSAHKAVLAALKTRTDLHLSLP